MAAFDLGQLPPVAAAVESLAAGLMQQPELMADGAGDARRGVQEYGLAAQTEAARFAAVDLHHAAGILAQRSPLESVEIAARAVTVAVETAVLAHDHGPGLPEGQGLTLYWPALAEFHNAAYSQATGLSNWETFINSYLNAPPGPLAPQINLVGRSSETASIQQPAYTIAEVTGRQIKDVALLVMQQSADGRQLLQHRQPLPPPITTIGDVTQLPVWEDGLHELTITWDTAGTFLQDGSGNGAYVIPWPVGPILREQASQIIAGQYRLAGQETLQNGNLVFTASSVNPGRLWGARPLTATPGNESSGAVAYAVAEIPLDSIDAFQPAAYVVEEDGRLGAGSGPLLALAPGQPLTREERPLPDGQYQSGLAVRSSGGAITAAWSPFAIANAGVVPGYTTFFDPAGGFHFLYPAEWKRPIYRESILSTSNLSETLTLQVRQFPQWPGDAATLQTEVLESFGEVSLLLEEELSVSSDAAIPARRVAYGYDHPQLGARTGVLTGFVYNGKGYVFDIDGPQASEAETLAVANLVADSWRFVGTDSIGRWTTLETDTFRVPQTVPFDHTLSNDWHRLSTGSQRFVAFRLQPASREPVDAVRALVQSAGQGVANFSAGDSYPFLLGGVIWQRADFSYLNSSDSDIYGLIMVRVENKQEIATWAEAPTAEFAGLAENVYLVSAAGFRQGK
jgi:hypothetical protein